MSKHAAWQCRGVPEAGQASISVGLADVQAASVRIAGMAVCTPVKRSCALGARLGAGLAQRVGLRVSVGR